MPKVNIEGVGSVNFPDTMTPDQIQSAIETDILPQAQKQATAPQQSLAPQAPPAATPSQAPFGSPTLGGVIRGGRDMVDAGAQLLTRGVEAIAPAGSGFEKWAKGERERVEGINKNAEQDYQQNWRGGGTGFDVPRFGGNLASSLLVTRRLPTPATLGGRVAQGGATGGLLGLTSKVDEGKDTGDFWKEKAKQGALGAAVGAAAPAAIEGVARLVRPQTSPLAQALMKEGVTPTPGQILGGGFKRAEEGLTSVPIVGDAIKSGQRRSLEEFNKAALNRTLEPIGEKVSSVGREGLEEATGKLSNAYETLLPKLKVKADEAFSHEIDTLRQMATNLPEAQAKQFENIIANEVIGKFTSSGNMTGETMKQVESKLGQMVRGYKGNQDFDKRQLADALSQVQSALKSMVTRNNPQHAPELAAINKGYANLIRVENATGRLGAEEGVFNPSQLMGAVRATDSSLRKGKFARGDAMMQDLAEAGKNVLSNKLPDSGTPYRAIVNAGAAGGAAMLNPKLAAAALLAKGLYTAPGQKLSAALLAKRPEFAEPLAEMIRNLSLPGSAMAQALMANQKP